MKNHHDQSIVLKKLCLTDAEEFFHLHRQPAVFGTYMQELNMNEEEKPLDFTKRLLWLSKGIYSIRLTDKPELIIGSALIYKGGSEKNEFYFGGTLLPNYHGKGILLKAFDQIIELAKYCYGIPEVKVFLNVVSKQANSTMDKLGFVKLSKQNDLLYYKSLWKHRIA
ncbi:GNAT family N-acetyltransferase [Olivibacter domesticus]|uniref:Protein N-acetyltransferase, RimJ/RimL family n=1 Tax=Olivibacter domesticus TaxID=407022 RepID=A0A1H7KG24_OLID1|nr:GNAT family N-acetyltransferase [Olivibacter domesticus]SEK85722.1 Protein N-acetyltransferase, RimJ/RimL family [Olivibacter domesticus]